MANGTYTVNFDTQFATSTNVMPVLIGVSNMEFLNTAGNQIFFSIDPKNFNTADTLKFYFEVKLGPVNSYYSKIGVKYLIAVTNDKVLLPIYIYTN